jgi:hypothetical protein
MTLTQAHIELLRQLEAKPQVSSVRLPPECHDLEQVGYTKITPLNLQDSRVEITLAGRVAARCPQSSTQAMMSGPMSSFRGCP